MKKIEKLIIYGIFILLCLMMIKINDMEIRLDIYEKELISLMLELRGGP